MCTVSSKASLSFEEALYGSESEDEDMLADNKGEDKEDRNADKNKKGGKNKAGNAQLQKVHSTQIHQHTYTQQTYTRTHVHVHIHRPH